MENLKKFRTTFIIISLLYILLGVTLIVRPELSVLSICKLSGAITLLFGLVRIIGYFRRDDFENVFRTDLSHGLIYLILGSFMLIAPKTVVSALPVILGLVIIIDSVLRIQLAVELKRLQEEQWWINLVLALITVVLGTLLLFNPFAGSLVLTMFIGIVLIINGVFNLWGILLFARVVKRVHAFKDTVYYQRQK